MIEMERVIIYMTTHNKRENGIKELTGSEKPKEGEGNGKLGGSAY